MAQSRVSLVELRRRVIAALDNYTNAWDELCRAREELRNASKSGK